jgi:hypothetical protein
MGQPKSSNDLGNSFLYAIPSRHDVTIYRQNWQAGQPIGQPQVALRLPFVFPLVSAGNVEEEIASLRSE